VDKSCPNTSGIIGRHAALDVYLCNYPDFRFSACIPRSGLVQITELVPRCGLHPLVFLLRREMPACTWVCLAYCLFGSFYEPLPCTTKYSLNSIYTEKASGTTFYFESQSLILSAAGLKHGGFWMSIYSSIMRIARNVRSDFWSISAKPFRYGGLN
jgi:hypothetical protein